MILVYRISIHKLNLAQEMFIRDRDVAKTQIQDGAIFNFTKKYWDCGQPSPLCQIRRKYLHWRPRWPKLQIQDGGWHHLFQDGGWCHLEFYKKWDLVPPRRVMNIYPCTKFDAILNVFIGDRDMTQKPISKMAAAAILNFTKTGIFGPA